MRDTATRGFVVVFVGAALLGAGPVTTPPIGSGSGSDAEVAPPKTEEGALPAQPVTSGAFGYPYVYSERFATDGDLPATALLKVQDRGVTAYLRSSKGDDSYAAGDRKVETKTDRLAYGVAPVFHLKGGMRLGVGLDSEEWEAKNAIDGKTAGKTGQNWQLTTLAIQAATHVVGAWAIGMKYSSSHLSLVGDDRGTGGARTRDDEHFSDIRPSLAFIRAAYELHLEFLPKIQYRAGAGDFTRPATTAIHVRRTGAPGRLVFADFDYGLWAATGTGRASAPTLRGGYVSSEPRWGDIGGSAGYRFKHYSAKTAAEPDTIGRYETTVFGAIRPDRDTFYTLSIEGSLGQDRGESPAGLGAAIRTQELTYQLAFARVN